MRRLLLFFTLCVFFVFEVNAQNDLVITGVFDGPLSGGVPKVIEIYAINDVADLSLYGIESANNGDPSSGSEFELSGSATAGDFIYLTTSASIDASEFSNYFGITHDFVTNSADNNGDDAIILFFDATGAFSGSESIVDVFGVVGTDGTGEAWEYLDGWAYRVDDTGPDGGTFASGNFTYSGINEVDGCTTNATCASEFPIGTYSVTAPPPPSTDVPTLSQWGLIILALSFMTFGTLYILERKVEMDA